MTHLLARFVVVYTNKLDRNYPEFSLIGINSNAVKKCIKKAAPVAGRLLSRNRLVI